MNDFFQVIGAIATGLVAVGIVRVFVFSKDAAQASYLRQLSNIYIAASQFVAVCVFREYPSNTISEALNWRASSSGSFVFNYLADAFSWFESKIEEAGY